MKVLMIILLMFTLIGYSICPGQPFKSTQERSEPLLRFGTAGVPNSPTDARIWSVEVSRRIDGLNAEEQRLAAIRNQIRLCEIMLQRTSELSREEMEYYTLQKSRFQQQERDSLERIQQISRHRI